MSASPPISAPLVLNGDILARLARVFSAYPDLESVVLFGSRALGTASSRSDIDLATTGILDRYRLGRLILDLEDLNIPQRCDVKAFEQIRYPPLREHIEAVGVNIYRRAEKGIPDTGQP